MIISSCPRCQESYLVPSGLLPDDAYAQCPWCRETFPIREALQRLPPTLTVFGADGQPIAPQAALASAAQGHDAPTGGLRSDFGFGESGGIVSDWSDRDAPAGLGQLPGFEEDAEPTSPFDSSAGGEVEPEFLIRDEANAAKPAPMRVQPMPGVSATPRRPQKRSSMKTMIGIALGPLLALPLAGAILLALGRAPDLGFWPFDGSYSQSGSSNRSAVSPLAQSAPADTRADTRADTPADTRADATPREGRSLALDLEPTAPTVDPETAALEELGATPDADSPPGDLEETADLPELTLDPREPLAVTPPDLTADEAPSTGGNDDEPIAPASDDNASDDDSMTDGPASSDTSAAMAVGDVAAADGEPGASGTPAVVEVTDADDVSSADPATPADRAAAPSDSDAAGAPAELVVARDKASELLARLANFSGSEQERKQLLASTYASIAEVGSLASVEHGSALAALVEQLRGNETLLNDLADAAPLWLNYSRRTNDGVLVVGEIDTSDDSPAIELKSGLEIPVDAAGIELTDGKLLGIGTIMETPAGRSVRLSIAQPL